MNMLQLLMFAVLAFVLLLLSGLHPVEWRVILLDTDWFYRKGAKVFYRLANRQKPWAAIIVIPLLGVGAVSLIIGIY